MAAERYLSRRIPDLRVGNNIDEIDKKLIPASIHPCFYCIFENRHLRGRSMLYTLEVFGVLAGQIQIRRHMSDI